MQVPAKKNDADNADIDVNGASYTVSRWLWTNVDVNNRVIGSRLQLPLKLYWASTIHKAKGLQLPKIVVYSDYEFTGGMLYVALSRVRKSENTQLVGFKREHLKSREQQIAELNALRFCDFHDHLSCCDGDVIFPNFDLEGDVVMDGDDDDGILEDVAVLEEEMNS